MIIAIEIAHDAWPQPIRQCTDAIAHELPIEGGGSATFAAGIFVVGTPQIDDSGRAKVSVTFGDESREVRNLIKSVIGHVQRPKITLRWYDDDEQLILGPTWLYMHDPIDNGPAIQFEGRSPNDDDLSAQTESFTLERNPTLWGRR